VGSADYLIESGLIPTTFAPVRACRGELLDEVASRIEQAGDLRYLRIHGDCHRNNVLVDSVGPHFVDLDDCMMGPAIQDCGCCWQFQDEIRIQL